MRRDQRMGGFTGLEVASILRDEGFTKPVIIFSAYLDPSLEAEAASRGFVAVSKADIPRLVEEVSGHQNQDPPGDRELSPGELGGPVLDFGGRGVPCISATTQSRPGRVQGPGS